MTSSEFMTSSMFTPLSELMTSSEFLTSSEFTTLSKFMMSSIFDCRNHSRAASRCGSRDGSPRRRSPIHFLPVSPSQKSMNSNYDYEEIENSISHDEQVPESFTVYNFGPKLIFHVAMGKTISSHSGP